MVKKYVESDKHSLCHYVYDQHEYLRWDIIGIKVGEKLLFAYICNIKVYHARNHLLMQNMVLQTSDSEYIMAWRFFFVYGTLENITEMCVIQPLTINAY